VGNVRENISTNPVTLYSSGLGSVGTSFNPEDHSENGGRLQIKGTLQGLAYFLAEKPTYKSILYNLKLDLMTSLSSRCSLWYEDLEQQAQSGSLDSVLCMSSFDFSVLAEQIWQVPRRIFLGFRETGIYICDYVLPREELSQFEKAIAERCLELVQFEGVTKEQIIQAEPLVKCLNGSVVQLAKEIGKKKILLNPTSKPEATTRSQPPTLYYFLIGTVLTSIILFFCLY